MSRAFLRRCALCKPEIADARAPVEAGRRWVVLVYVIEGAIVSRIDCEIAVITPPIGSARLAPCTVEKMLLPRQGIQRVCRQTTRVTDLRVN
jgi:hypothetical protein